ncbi:sugar phosphate isomerase/epimerase [Pedobacter sp. ASV1-7]|uniref:sugar phosphate isomerase/epimerase family protein n=1 Tax=Pedobacter sp. ASV1-7 TaxID=3145237 RepID=UPI0032E924DD
MKYLFVFFYLSLLLVFKGQSQNMPEKKYGWTLSAQTFTFKSFTFTEALDKTVSCGLKTIEAYVGQEIGGGIAGKIHYRMDQELQGKIKRLLKEKKIQLIALGVVSGTTEKEWQEIFEFASAMKISTINSEPAKKFLSLVGKLASQHKIKVGIHNHPKPTRYWHPDSVLNAIDLAKSSYVGACADIGHWLRSGLDPVTCLKLYKGKLKSLHFKDLIPKDNKFHDVHWGTGLVNILAVTEELKRQKFRGNISAEYEYNWKNNVPDVTASIQNFRKLISK